MSSPKYSPLPSDEPSLSATSRKDRLKHGATKLFAEIKDALTPRPASATQEGNTVAVQYPLHGGFTSQMAIEVVTFPELDLPYEVACGTLLAINSCLARHGPRYHLPIYIAGTAMLVTTVWGGLVVAVIGGVFLGIKKRRAKRALRELLIAENARPEYTSRSIRWILTDRGVEVEQTRVAPTPAAVPDYTTPPFHTPSAPVAPSLYPAPAVISPEGGKWAAELEQLRAMGYRDDARSLALLQQQSGRVPAVVDALLA